MAGYEIATHGFEDENYKCMTKNSNAPHQLLLIVGSRYASIKPNNKKDIVKGVCHN